MLKVGHIVYWKRAKINTNRKTPEIEFKGHGFGILLGNIPPFIKEPSIDHIFRILGSMGFMTFDNVQEWLGKEQLDICVQKFREKYYKIIPATGEEDPQASVNEESDQSE